MGTHLKLVHGQKSDTSPMRRPDLTPCPDCGALVKNLERHRSKIHLNKPENIAGSPIPTVSPVTRAVPLAVPAAPHAGACPRCGKFFKNVAAHYVAKHPQQHRVLPAGERRAAPDPRASLVVAARLQEQIHRDLAVGSSEPAAANSPPLKFDTFAAQLPRSRSHASGRCWKCGAPLFVETGVCSRADCTANASD
jgi:hypothetical protein